MIQTKDARLPKYLLDNGIEFFALNGHAFKLQNGVVTQFKDFSDANMEVIKHDFYNDVRGQIGLDRIGMHNASENERIEQWLICNYGAFDTKADIFNDERQREYYDCGRHGCCEGEHWVCKPVIAQGGELTKRETEITQLICQGFFDHEIADHLFVSEDTVKNHRRNIQQKLGKHTKSAIAAFGVSMNLIPK